MRYSQIRDMDISNGNGVGISLFVQGCHFHCKGCFNQETWDFNGGKEWTNEVKDKFIKLADRPYIKRISILGGEPLADENVNDVFQLISELNKTYPTKKIWVYTGYSWENIMKVFENNKETNKNDFMFLIPRFKIVSNIDILVDGQFQLQNQDLYNKDIIWAGSTNQRIIDCQRSLKENNIVLAEI